MRVRERILSPKQFCFFDRKRGYPKGKRKYDTTLSTSQLDSERIKRPASFIMNQSLCHIHMQMEIVRTGERSPLKNQEMILIRFGYQTQLCHKDMQRTVGWELTRKMQSARALLIKQLASVSLVSCARLIMREAVTGVRKNDPRNLAHSSELGGG